MKSYFKYLLINLILLSQLDCIAINNESLEGFVQGYFTSIIDYSNKLDNTAFANLMYMYYDTNLGTHHNELNKIKYDFNIIGYLSEIEKKYHGNIKVEITSESILDCTNINKENGKTFKYARFTKTVTLPNEKPKTFNFLMIIDVTNSDNKITDILLSYFLINEETNLLSKCTKNTDSEKQLIEQELLQKQVNDLIKQADVYYSNMQYTEALKTYELVLKINSDNINAIDGTRNCKELISVIGYENTINNLINENKFEDALEELEIATKNNIRLEKQFIENISFKCLKGIEQNKLTNYLRLGNYYLENGQIKLALKEFQEAHKLDVKNKSILSKIEECRNGDPDYVQQQLSIAYKNAILSKKNYLSTFKTYKKYENSKLLTGKQYLFMMLMMLDKPSTVVRPMDYSNNLALNLSKEYFYKAKDRGVNVSFYETQIFTKSIEKHKKK